MTEVTRMKKPFYKKWWVWVIVVVVVFAIIGGEEESNGTSSQNSNVESGVNSGNTSEGKSSNKTKTETIGSVGTPLTVGDVEFIVNGITANKNVGGQYGVNSQGIFLLVDVTISNKSNKAITTDSSFFKLLVGDMVFDADSSATIYANSDTSFFLEKINPTLSLTGKVVFDVSESIANESGIMLQVQTGIWGAETGKISLQ